MQAAQIVVVLALYKHTKCAMAIAGVTSFTSIQAAGTICHICSQALCAALFGSKPHNRM